MVVPPVATDRRRQHATPRFVPWDPADRLIVAAARQENAALVTRDQKLLACRSQGFVRVDRARTSASATAKSRAVYQVTYQ
jgi:hypothetical protein